MCELVFGANLTAADARTEIARLECLALWPVELRALFNGGQPEAELVDEVVASSAGSVTLDEWSGTEVFQARSRAGERLAASLGPSTRVLEHREDIYFKNLDRSLQIVVP